MVDQNVLNPIDVVSQCKQLCLLSATTEQASLVQTVVAIQVQAKGHMQD